MDLQARWDGARVRKFRAPGTAMDRIDRRGARILVGSLYAATVALDATLLAFLGARAWYFFVIWYGAAFGAELLVAAVMFARYGQWTYEEFSLARWQGPGEFMNLLMPVGSLSAAFMGPGRGSARHWLGFGLTQMLWSLLPLVFLVASSEQASGWASSPAGKSSCQRDAAAELPFHPQGWFPQPNFASYNDFDRPGGFCTLLARWAHPPAASAAIQGFDVVADPGGGCAYTALNGVDGFAAPATHVQLTSGARVLAWPNQAVGLAAGWPGCGDSGTRVADSQVFCPGNEPDPEPGCPSCQLGAPRYICPVCLDYWRDVTGQSQYEGQYAHCEAADGGTTRFETLFCGLCPGLGKEGAPWWAREASVLGADLDVLAAMATASFAWRILRALLFYLAAGSLYTLKRADRTYWRATALALYEILLRWNHTLVKDPHGRDRGDGDLGAGDGVSGAGAGGERAPGGAGPEAEEAGPGALARRAGHGGAGA